MRHPPLRSHYIYISFRRLSRARARASGSELEAYTVARGRDLMRFYCPNDVTGPLFSEPVARRETVDSIYRVYTGPCFDIFQRCREIGRMRCHHDFD